MSLEGFVICMLGVVNLLWVTLVCKKVTRVEKLLLTEKYSKKFSFSWNMPVKQPAPPPGETKE